jgi:acetoin utilization deacetylase AcuC-like enzyme
MPGSGRKKGNVLRAFHSPLSTRHDPDRYFRGGRIVEHPERAERYDVLLGAAVAAGLEPVEAGEADRAALARVHTGDYLEFLETAWSRRAEIPGVEDELLNGHFAKPQMHRRPTGLLGQLGYYASDTSTPIRAGTWDAIQASAAAALAAADDALENGGAYALCRPPGHHAFADCAAGFCYLNNSAIAARRMADRMAGTGTGRVAVVDIDVHHGNGTQSIFYATDAILTVSVHCDTSDYYPFYAGYADETGEGAGAGFNLNLPLARGSGDTDVCDALERGLALCANQDCAAVVVALGLDAARDDPLGAFDVTTDGFARLGERIAAFGVPTALIQEGGYLCDALPENLTAFLQTFDGARRGVPA